MPSESANPLPDTTDQLQDATTDVTDALERMARAFEGLAPHLERLVSEGIKLHPVEAVKEIPVAVTETAEKAGAAAGTAAEGAGHVVAAAPAVVTDTLETGDAAGRAVARKAARFTLRKGRH